MKVVQITASFQNPTKITALLRKTPEAFYFVNLEVTKGVEFHETRENLFLLATREMLQVLFSHNMSKWLTYCSLFCSKDIVTGIICALGKNVKKQHL